MLIETVLTPVEVDCICDTCGVGRMRPIGTALTTAPPTYPHRCTNCNEKANYQQRYPHITYRRPDGA